MPACNWNVYTHTQNNKKNGINYLIYILIFSRIELDSEERQVRFVKWPKVGIKRKRKD